MSNEDGFTGNILRRSDSGMKEATKLIIKSASKTNGTEKITRALIYAIYARRVHKLFHDLLSMKPRVSLLLFFSTSIKRKSRKIVNLVFFFFKYSCGS